MRTGDLFAPLGHSAAEVAADNAGSGWRDAATDHVRAFAAAVGRPFVASEAVSAAEIIGLDSPPEARAWGAIFKELKEAGAIRPVGIGRSVNPRHHGSFCTLWESGLGNTSGRQIWEGAA